MIIKKFFKFQLGFIFVSLMLITIPFFQTFYTIVSLNKLQEKADLKYPEKAVDYISYGQNWFRKNFGFREFFIKLNSQISFSLFASSDKLHIGSDGWLFYRAVIDEGEPNIEKFSDKQIFEAIESIEKLRDWLSPRGIHLILLTPQLKDKFYTDFLPYTAWRAKKRHRFDEYRKQLRAVEGITYIDATEILNQLKISRPVFHKTDFHWNDPAAFVIARKIVNEIAILENKKNDYWTNDVEVEKRELSGGEANFMPLFKPPKEMAFFVVKNWQDKYTYVENPPEPFEYVSTVPKHIDALPNLVVLGDSFFDGFLRSGINNYFRSVSRIRIFHTTTENAMQSIPLGTKYFLLEFIETALPSFQKFGLPPEK